MTNTGIVIVTKPHYVKDLNDLARGCESQRRLLPQIDGCRVAITRFRMPAETRVENIQYEVDETFIVLNGFVVIIIDGKQRTVRKHEEVHVPAGCIYTLQTMSQGCMLECIFSPIPGFTVQIDVDKNADQDSPTDEYDARSMENALDNGDPGRFGTGC